MLAGYCTFEKNFRFAFLLLRFILCQTDCLRFNRSEYDCSEFVLSGFVDCQCHLSGSCYRVSSLLGIMVVLCYRDLWLLDIADRDSVRFDSFKSWISAVETYHMSTSRVFCVMEIHHVSKVRVTRTVEIHHMSKLRVIRDTKISGSAPFSLDIRLTQFSNQCRQRYRCVSTPQSRRLAQS